MSDTTREGYCLYLPKIENIPLTNVLTIRCDDRTCFSRKQSGNLFAHETHFQLIKDAQNSERCRSMLSVWLLDAERSNMAATLIEKSICTPTIRAATVAPLDHQRLYCELQRNSLSSGENKWEHTGVLDIHLLRYNNIQRYS